MYKYNYNDGYKTEFPVKIHECENNPFIGFVAKLFREKYYYTANLNQLQTLLDKLPVDEKEKCTKIKTLGVNDRECPFIQDFHEAVDASPEFNDIYHAFVRKYIMPMFPLEKKLVIQKTPNIRFSFPTSAAIGDWTHNTRQHDKNQKKTEEREEKEERIGFHCDSDFGHHFSEMNFILPITEMYGTNSVYYELSHNDGEYNYEYANLTMMQPNNQFFQGYLNKLKHYNRINQTGHTRISFDMRVIPYSEYIEYLDAFKGTKFELGKYYIVL